MDFDYDPEPREHKVHLEVKFDSTYKRKSYLPIFRYSAFVVLEACFIALAFYCYVSPRRLPFQELDTTRARSGYQTLFNTWNNITIALAASICRETFSKEWAARRDSPTDAVSKVTSGVIDRALYFFTSRATRTYRVAFAASIILILMQSISSSTIPVTSGIGFMEEIPIGLLSAVDISANWTNPNEQGFAERLSRAGTVVRLEKLNNNSPWGLSPPPNWLIPLPSTTGNITGHVYYDTDLVQFWHQCTWRLPSLDNEDADTYIVDGQKWALIPEGDISEDKSNTGPGSTIQQLFPPDPIQDLNGTSVYLFLGGNSTFPVKTANSSVTWIDLSGLPTLYNPSQFTAYHPISLKIGWVASPLATLLVCGVDLNPTTGHVSIIPSTNISNPDLIVSDDRPVPKVGNIDPDAVNVLFSLSLYTASNEPDEMLSEQAIDYINFNSILSGMFMPEPPSGSWTNSSAVKPQPLNIINSRVDNYKLSALKAFTTGYKPESSIARVQGVFSKIVEANYVDDSAVLATSLPFAVVHVVLATVEAVLLVILVVLNRKQNRLPFELAHVKEE